jgi:N-acetyl-gamma-glutamyl-phosphate reductase
VLAVPNGVADQWARAIAAAHPDAVIVDLSADHRFDDEWEYGLPELNRESIAGARHIANPGCYATAGMLGLWPLRARLVGTPSLFGVSGYSGAGRTPSPRNDPQALRDNLVPYKLGGHVHELEVSRHLGYDVRFMPHVAAFFRGISMTISAELDTPTSPDELLSVYAAAYANEARIRVSADIPEVRQVVHTPNAHIGGFTVDAREPRRITLVSVLDNLSKGAASQALQNLNLALGLDERSGLDHD